MQSTNFEFLRQNWPELADLGGYAELYAHNDPPSSRFKSRLLAEHLALLACERLNLPIAGDNFLAMLKELEAVNALPKVVLDIFHQVRIAGNKAAHRLSNDSGHALDTVKGAFDLCRWWVLLTTGTKEGIPLVFQPVKPATTPSPQHEVEQLEKLRAITEALVAENEQLRKRQAELTAEAQANIRKDNQFAFYKTASEAADALLFDEAETRKRLIDTMLLTAGWDVTDSDQVQMEVALGGHPTESGTGYADYVLYDDDGTALAVIEAKRTAESPAKGRKQAQDYADALEKQSAKGVRPLIILSNGYETTLVDDWGGPTSLVVHGYADRQIRFSFQGQPELSRHLSARHYVGSGPTRAPAGHRQPPVSS